MKLAKTIALLVASSLAQPAVLALETDAQTKMSRANEWRWPLTTRRSQIASGTQHPAGLGYAGPREGAEAENVEWKIDPVHTRASFTIKHMMMSNVRGDFTKVSGRVNYGGKSVANAEVTAVIDAASINTNEQQRDQHIRSQEFLDVNKYPNMTFKSKKIEVDTNGFKILGDLTVHGVTKPVILSAEPLPPPIKDPFGFLRTGTEARTTINRKDFNISYNQLMDNGGALVGDNVDIVIDVELVRKPPATAESKPRTTAESKRTI